MSRKGREHRFGGTHSPNLSCDSDDYLFSELWLDASASTAINSTYGTGESNTSQEGSTYSDHRRRWCVSKRTRQHHDHIESSSSGYLIEAIAGYCSTPYTELVQYRPTRVLGASSRSSSLIRRVVTTSSMACLTYAYVICVSSITCIMCTTRITRDVWWDQ